MHFTRKALVLLTILSTAVMAGIEYTNLGESDIAELQKVTGATTTDLENAIDRMEAQERYWVPQFASTYKLVPDLIKKYNLQTACEVGVAFGTYSESILKHTNATKVYSVDPFVHQTVEGYSPQMNYKQLEFDVLYYMNQKRLRPYGNRSVILRTTSEEASKTFDDESLDIVYVDAFHEYEAVKKDLSSWFPKIRPGGIISGDDYNYHGVRDAVNDFFATIGLTVYTTPPRNWYVLKPKDSMTPP